MPSKPGGRGRGGRGTGGRGGGGGRGAQQSGGDAAPGWRRSAGALSAKAKKEYLQWKRQQKAARGDDSDSDGSGDEGAQLRRTVALNRQDATTPQALTDSDVLSDASESEVEEGEEEVQGEAGPASAAHRARAADAAAAREHAADARNTPPSAAEMEAPLVYQPLDEIPWGVWDLGDIAAAEGDSSGGAAEGAGGGDEATPKTARMVRLRAEEVGQTKEGRSLGMPTRPAWQGVVRTADQLHALEEKTFEAWRADLERRFGAEGAGRLSFYETRLEFWRQLWRTLEMSDVLAVVVDARNPLLHFPDALYRHATHDLGLPLLLLLNKCDLIPPGAAAAWRAWFEAHYPGLRALPVSASPAAAAQTQREVLAAVLEMKVARGKGGTLQRVGEVVSLSLDDLINESLRRNTHAKRHALPTKAATSAAPPAAQDESDGDSDEEGWTVKGTKAAKKDAQRRKRRTRATRRGGGAADSGRDDSDGEGQGGGGGGAAAGGSGEEDEEGEEGEEDEEAAELQRDMELLTCEGRLGSLSGPTGQPASSGASGEGGAKASAAAAGGGAPVVVGLVGEPNVGKSSTLNALLGSHRVAVSSHPGRTKHYQTHYVSRHLVLCDCPGLVFPRLDVSLPMQVLFGSFPIAHCRDPYAVVRYMAERVWPRLQDALRLRPPLQGTEDGGQGGERGGGAAGGGGGGGASEFEWSPLALCEALADRHNWRSRRGGRADVYRAANWLLRGALAGRSSGLVLAFLPPVDAAPDGGGAVDQVQQHVDGTPI